MLGTYNEDEFLTGLKIVDSVPEGFTAADKFDARDTWGGYIHPIRD
jgi:hypothetical protein